MVEIAEDKDQGEKLFSEERLFGTGEARRVFTNMTSTILLISDLGQRDSAGRISEMESIGPHETKDLGAFYSDETLLKSKILRSFIKEGRLIEGRSDSVTPRIKDEGDILRERGAQMNEFTDPTENDYDKRLKAVQEKEKLEDEESKVGSGRI